MPRWSEQLGCDTCTGKGHLHNRHSRHRHGHESHKPTQAGCSSSNSRMYVFCHCTSTANIYTFLFYFKWKNKKTIVVYMLPGLIFLKHSLWRYTSSASGVASFVISSVLSSPPTLKPHVSGVVSASMASTPIVWLLFAGGVHAATALIRGRSRTARAAGTTLCHCRPDGMVHLTVVTNTSSSGVDRVFISLSLSLSLSLFYLFIFFLTFSLIFWLFLLLCSFLLRREYFNIFLKNSWVSQIKAV